MDIQLDKTITGIRRNVYNRMFNDYNSMIEELRTRLNVLSTSLFLLHESTKLEDPKLKRYLKNVNDEMERIRQLISNYPKNFK